tara:strand:- start:7738 stop:7947 length:210 start_codon:yes stop_codon:yes gene_type:complete
MKKQFKRVYEVFNMETQEWEKKTMTEDQYREMQESASRAIDELDAEYEIISKIISQNLGVRESNDKSRD